MDSYFWSFFTQLLGQAWGLQDIAVERISGMESSCILSVLLVDVLPLLCSKVIAEVVTCLYGTFIVCFSISFLLASL